MLIKSAEFVISNTNYKLCPQDGRTEYAFIGRSNVGKSSLINMLTNHKGLAKTSSMPGKTMLINHFLINDEWYLVDLPGYGFARRGKESREELKKLIEDYILEREALTSLFVLVDSRHKPQQIDLEFMEWLGEHGVPFSIVFTKADKQGNMRLKQNVENYEKELMKVWEALPPIFITSAEKRMGRDALLGYIDTINDELKGE